MDMELHNKKTFSTPINYPKLSRDIYAFMGTHLDMNIALALQEPCMLPYLALVLNPLMDYI
jgi:hypothetical protein